MAGNPLEETGVILEAQKSEQTTGARVPQTQGSWGGGLLGA